VEFCWLLSGKNCNSCFVQFINVVYILIFLSPFYVFRLPSYL
jgi:hypothetical protein